MDLGESLYQARKKCGLSQEEVAAHLGVSRQTISKWETDETLPDIRQSKKLANLYHLTLDELIDYDEDIKEIEKVIEKTSEEKQSKINWTKLWGQKYPILNTYQQEVDMTLFAIKLDALLSQLVNEYGYNETDAMLVLKDILAKTWKERINQS